MQYVSQNARFSSCKRYRYRLEREWEEGTGTVLFIGLNPSTADHRKDDPTIRRCVRFARDWGYRRMQIVNLFAYRATYTEDLLAADDPVGGNNDRWIARSHREADLTIACWGNHGMHLERDRIIRKKLGGLHCLRMNRSRQPAHPLYLKASLRPRPMTTDTR